MSNNGLTAVHFWGLMGPMGPLVHIIIPFEQGTFKLGLRFASAQMSKENLYTFGIFLCLSGASLGNLRASEEHLEDLWLTLGVP